SAPDSHETRLLITCHSLYADISSALSVACRRSGGALIADSLNAGRGHAKRPACWPGARWISPKRSESGRRRPLPAVVHALALRHLVAADLPVLVRVELVEAAEQHGHAGFRFA